MKIKTNKSKALILALSAITIASLSWYLSSTGYLSLEKLQQSLSFLEQQYDDKPVLFIAMYVAVYAATVSFFIPGLVPLNLLAGAIFGPIMGTATAVISATFGSLIGFLTSRYVFSDWVDEKFPKKTEKINDMVEKHSWMTLVLLRVTPALPVGLTNLIIGVTKVNVRVFIIATLIGVVPWTAFYVIAGMELSSIEKMSDIVSTEIMLLVFTLIILMVVGRTLASRFKLGS